MKAEADIAKTSSEAYKNNQQGAGFGVDNSQKRLGAINGAITQGAMTGDKTQVLLGLDGLRRTGMISDDDYTNFSSKLNLMTPNDIKQWGQGVVLSGAKDPSSYFYQTANNAADNAQSDINNQRTTQASIYSTDKNYDLGQSRLQQDQHQFDTKLEYQRQQDEIKNRQGEVKEFGGKAYVVYKDGTYRPALDANGQHISSASPNSAKIQNDQREETMRIDRVDAILPEIEKILPNATNSYLGTGVDLMGNAFGYSTGGSKATAQLKTLSGQLVSLMPKMSGPQSDKDVAMYKEMAGNLSDPTIPIETRMAALQTIRELNSKYKSMSSAGQQQKTVDAAHVQSFFQ
ncbi:hypothetical protein MN869_05550 [Acinetobacter sp. NIPH1876]|uniref:hypothetical protein n=1 Tax=unclassified Acinetobacter TaxID=196816 RepID=UPI001FABD515|nr:hypothetical protein [Acinetobacter sp. NIPH1876]MCJ0827922.1 hypothetical protein [Acinetobacter sp. NIPH1876]